MSPICAMDEYILIEILKRLPAKNLCRFQSVSKQWKSLISPFFINLHRNFTHSATPYHLKPYLRVKSASIENTFIDLCRPIAGNVKHSIESLPVPFHPKKDPTFKDITFIDCINGVICLFYSTFTNTIVLWNPTIHKYITLPPLGIQCGGFGFGYDSTSDDFKVIWVSNLLFRQGRLYYMIYSCRQNCWSPPYLTFSLMEEDGDDRSIKLKKLKKRSCFVNGTIYWILDVVGKRQRLIMFDCECEGWDSVELDMTVWKLMNYKGRLGALLRDNDSSSMEMWVMEGGGNMWKKVFKFNDSSLCRLYEYKYYDYEETMELMAHQGVQSYPLQDMEVNGSESECVMA